MDDLQLTKLCALASGSVKVIKSDMHFRGWADAARYDPLRNDAQAMNLLKRFPRETITALYEAIQSHARLDVNRTIVESVANTYPPA